jgi:hypothetical protein
VNVKTHQTFWETYFKEGDEKASATDFIRGRYIASQKLGAYTTISIYFKAWTSKSSKIRDWMDDMVEYNIVRGYNLLDSVLLQAQGWARQTERDDSMHRKSYLTKVYWAMIQLMFAEKRANNSSDKMGSTTEMQEKIKESRPGFC